MTWDYQFEEEAKRELSDLGPAAAEQIIAYLDTRIMGAANAEQFGKPLCGSKHGLWRCRGRGYRLLCRLER